MSLFPAFAQNPDNVNTNQAENWLSNSSYVAPKHSTDVQTDAEVTEMPLPVVSNEKVESKSKKRKKTKEIKLDEPNEEFTIDVKMEKIFFTLPYLTYPTCPKYKPKKDQTVKEKKRRTKRYFTKDISKNPEQSSQTTEIELTEQVKHYNKELDRNPDNIQMWLDYVNFQDVKFTFDRTYWKSKNRRIIAEKKLAILDKALSINVNNRELLEKRFQIAREILTTDELIKDIETIIEKTNAKPSLTLWKIYIETFQISMVKCSASKVLKMYGECLKSLNQTRRTSDEAGKIQIEMDMLEMMQRCALFLRQSGLWEQVFALTRMYLEMNVMKKDVAIDMTFTGDEDDVLKMEEMVIGTRLPSHEVWYRVETIRQIYHFLPSNDPKCLDPQRLVLLDDLTDLVYPIIDPENTFRLTITLLHTLKIPLIPTTHALSLQLNVQIPWTIDVIEHILPAFINQSSNDALITNLLILLTGPRYLTSNSTDTPLLRQMRVMCGQKYYLDFVSKTLLTCAKCFDSAKRNALYVWWFKFQCFLIDLERRGLILLPKNYAKTLKAIVKDLMRDDRNNLFVYREYALLELVVNGFDAAWRILTAALRVQDVAIIEMTNCSDRTAILSIYRTMVEMLINQEDVISQTNRNRALNCLISIVSSKTINLNENTPTNETIFETTNKFDGIYKQLLDNLSNDVAKNLEDHFLPDYSVDMIACYGWFLYLTDHAEIFERIETILKDFECDSHRRELLYEFYVILLHKHCTDRKGGGVYRRLYDVIFDAIRWYPNNLTCLGLLCTIQKASKTVNMWRKLKPILVSRDNANVLPQLFSIFILGQQIEQLKDAHLAALECQGGSPTECLGLTNKVSKLFEELTASESFTRSNGLIWRLYLSFLFHTIQDCKPAFYQACEACPWLNSLFMDAAVYLPSELDQVLDVLVEKELRIHLDPEELQALIG